MRRVLLRPPVHAGRSTVRTALAALAVGRAFRARDIVMRSALGEFPGVPHRMEEVGTIAGVRYINDTTATAPAAATIIWPGP